MQAAAAQVFQLAHRQTAQVRAMLEDVAERFNSTFALTAHEVDTLNVLPELHEPGAAVELSFPGQEITFSLRPLAPRGSVRQPWELMAYHGEQTAPERVCTMLLGRATEDGVRRRRGARLVAAIGDYLDSQVSQRETQETMVVVLRELRSETDSPWLPQIAASHRVYHA